jgi:hypothetical protein
MPDIRSTQPPTGEQIAKVMSLADSSIEIAAYARDQVTAKIQKSKQAANYHTVLEEMENFYNLVVCKCSFDDSHWTLGRKPTSFFINMQHNVADQAVAASNLADMSKLRFDYALSEDGHLLRRWRENIEPGEVDADTQKKPFGAIEDDASDKLFNAWLSEQHLRSEKGRIVETDDKGNILMRNGEPIPVKPTAFKELSEKENTGIQTFFQNKGFELTKQDHPFQAPVKAEEVAPKAKTVAVPTQAAAPVEKTPAPETAPSTGAGRVGG